MEHLFQFFLNSHLSLLKICALFCKVMVHKRMVFLKREMGWHNTLTIYCYKYCGIVLKLYHFSLYLPIINSLSKMAFKVQLIHYKSNYFLIINFSRLVHCCTFLRCFSHRWHIRPSRIPSTITASWIILTWWPLRRRTQCTSSLRVPIFRTWRAHRRH